MTANLVFLFAAAVLPVVAQASAIAIGVLIAAWVLGGVLLRLGGLVTATLGLALGAAGYTAGLLLALPGLLLWLAGHWHYALRHHTYKSPLARRVFLAVLPRPMDPTRRWSMPTTTRGPGPWVSPTGDREWDTDCALALALAAETLRSTGVQHGDTDASA